MKVHEAVSVLETHNPDAELVIGSTGDGMRLVLEVEDADCAAGWHIAGEFDRPVVFIVPDIDEVKINNDPRPPQPVTLSASDAAMISRQLARLGYEEEGYMRSLLSGHLESRTR